MDAKNYTKMPAPANEKVILSRCRKLDLKGVRVKELKCVTVKELKCDYTAYMTH